MAYPTLTMRKIREVLRLHFDCGFKQREIARAVGTSPTTVGQYVRRMQRAGLSWPLSSTLSDDELEARLFPPPPLVEGQRPEPDWPSVRRELSRKGVTLDLLWNEYKAEHPDGYEFRCDDGSPLRVVFALDCCDREAMSWAATTGGYTGDMVRDVMLQAVENRFDGALKADNEIE